jgi:hypothetical protein
MLELPKTVAEEYLYAKFEIVLNSASSFEDEPLRAAWFQMNAKPGTRNIKICRRGNFFLDPFATRVLGEFDPNEARFFTCTNAS